LSDQTASPCDSVHTFIAYSKPKMKSAVAVALVGGTVAVHPDRLAQVELINNSPGVTWKAAVHSRFVQSAPGESKSSNGVKAGQKQSLEDAVKRGVI